MSKHPLHRLAHGTSVLAKMPRDAGEADHGTRVDRRHGQPHPCSLEEGITAPSGGTAGPGSELRPDRPWTPGFKHPAGFEEAGCGFGISSSPPSSEGKDPAGFWLAAGGHRGTRDQTPAESGSAKPQAEPFPPNFKEDRFPRPSPCSTGPYGEEKDVLKSRGGSR